MSISLPFDEKDFSFCTRKGLELAVKCLAMLEDEESEALFEEDEFLTLSSSARSAIERLKEFDRAWNSVRQARRVRSLLSDISRAPFLVEQLGKRARYMDPERLRTEAQNMHGNGLLSAALLEAVELYCDGREYELNPLGPQTLEV